MNMADRDLRTLLIIKNVAGFKSVRSGLKYLGDGPTPKTINEKVYGLDQIAKKLGFNWSKQADIKRTQRTLRRFKIPYSKKGNKVYVYQSDINNFKEQILTGKRAIAEFLGISTKTLSRWLKLPRYAKVPIVRDKTLYANKHKLYKWNIMRMARKSGVT